MSDSEQSAIISDNHSDTEERVNIRHRLSNMSFEDLQKLKEKVGSKVYNKAVFGATEKKRKDTFKRANKNRPREESAKKRPRSDWSLHQKKKNIPRDPRFDPLCGEFDNSTFRKNYEFVTDLRKEEKVKLEKELENTQDQKEKTKIKFVVQRLNNQIREHEKVKIDDQKKHEEKKLIKEQLKRGEKPQFKKKSVKRMENLMSKYEELKKSNKLEKYLEKKSKEQLVKERRTFQKEQSLAARRY